MESAKADFATQHVGFNPMFRNPVFIHRMFPRTRSAIPMTAKIHQADLYGTRKLKYDTLLNSDFTSIDWQEIEPNLLFYLFRPQEHELREEY